MKSLEASKLQLKMCKINKYKICYAFFLSWFLAVVFNGSVTSTVRQILIPDSNYMLLVTLLAFIAGLIISGFFINNMNQAKFYTLISSLICFIFSFGLFGNAILLKASVILISLFSGAATAGWGYFFKNCFFGRDRFMAIADILIIANIAQIPVCVSIEFISLYLGFGIAMVYLIIAAITAFKIDDSEVVKADTRYIIEYKPELKYPLIFLYLFVFLVSISVGLNYQVIGPQFSQFTYLDGFYGFMIYALGAFAVKKLSVKFNHYYTLYIAIAMIGLTVISFVAFDDTLVSYLLVNTLTNIANAVLDLFCWCFIGELLNLTKKASLLLGIAISANLLGVFTGGIFAIPVNNAVDVEEALVITSITVVLIMLVLFPILNKVLSCIFKDNIFLLGSVQLPEEEEENYSFDDVLKEYKLTKREIEVAHVLIENTGTYKMIANELNISENTAKTHIKNIYSKLGINSRVELINLSLK